MRTHQLEGRKREEWVGELQNMARHKRGLTNWRRGRGRSGLVSFKAWHVTNENSLTGGEEKGGAGWRAQKCGTLQTRMHQQGGGRGRSPFVSLETWHVTEGSLTGGQEKGEAHW